MLFIVSDFFSRIKLPTHQTACLKTMETRCNPRQNFMKYMFLLKPVLDIYLKIIGRVKERHLVINSLKMNRFYKCELGVIMLASVQIYTYHC